MRTYEGIEITEDFVDDLVTEWHENQAIMPTTLGVFIRSNTGWTVDEFEAWVVHGTMPE